VYPRVTGGSPARSVQRRSPTGAPLQIYRKNHVQGSPPPRLSNRTWTLWGPIFIQPTKCSHARNCTHHTFYVKLSYYAQAFELLYQSRRSLLSVRLRRGPHSPTAAVRSASVCARFDPPNGRAPPWPRPRNRGRPRPIRDNDRSRARCRRDISSLRRSPKPADSGGPGSGFPSPTSS